MKLKEYVVYKGETFICIGTVQECAERMGVLPKTVRYYTSPSYKKSAAKRKAANYFTVMRLDDSNEPLF